MIHILAGAAAAGFATAALSDTWSLAEGDQEIAGEDLAVMLFGHRVTFEDGSTGRFRIDGSYLFTAVDGEEWLWQEVMFLSDGSLCLKHDGKVRRCDLYVINSGELILINAIGERYRAFVD